MPAEQRRRRGDAGAHRTEQRRAQHAPVPVFNMVPAPGEPAQFGFEVEKVQVILKTEVLTNENYAVAVRTTETSQLAQVLSAQVTLWGEPGAEAHDTSRGWACLVPCRDAGPCNPPAQRPTIPFLRLPTSCEPLDMAVKASPGRQARRRAGSCAAAAPTTAGRCLPVEVLAGCGSLPFNPSIDLTPEQPAGEHPERDDGRRQRAPAAEPAARRARRGRRQEHDRRAARRDAAESRGRRRPAGLQRSAGRSAIRLAPAAVRIESKVGVVHIQIAVPARERERQANRSKKSTAPSISPRRKKTRSARCSRYTSSPNRPSRTCSSSSPAK